MDRKKHLLTLLDFSEDEILEFINIARDLKEKKKKGIPHEYLKGKNIVLLFEKDSTRTRCSFEVAASDLGMSSTYLGPTGSQMGKKESIKDTARVLSRIYDGIEYRGYGQKIVEEIAEYSLCPVFNGLTNEFHPTQVLADALTIYEHFGYLKGIKMAYVGDARYNMGNSLMILGAKLGFDFRSVAPKELWTSDEIYEKCLDAAKLSGAKITRTTDVCEGVSDVDVIVTDVWVSMGEPDSVWKERIEMLLPYQVNNEMMSKANKNAIFMHCLPSFHNLETKVGKEVYDKFGLNGLEVSEDVFEAPYSKVFEEAENRLHTIKAVIYKLMK